MKLGLAHADCTRRWVPATLLTSRQPRTRRNLGASHATDLAQYMALAAQALQRLAGRREGTIGEDANDVQGDREASSQRGLLG